MPLQPGERVWDRFLTDRDRRTLEATAHAAPGTRPVLILIDFIRWVYGDRREALEDAILRWPGSCGEAAWDALPHVQRVLATARANGIPVIHTTQSEAIPGWRDRPRGFAGADPAIEERRRHRYEIIPELAPAPGEAVLYKTAPSAFHQTRLIQHLRGLDADTLIIAGESTSGCVRATVVDGKSYRYPILMPEECVFDRHEAPHAINLFDMEQKYAHVLPTDEAVAYMDRIGAARRAAAGA